MCVKIEQKGGVFVHSNIYEYLCDRLDNIPRILALCGADRRYTGKNSSDFEKFRELCRTHVSFSGSSFYRDINYAVSELFGESIDITQSSPEDLWKRFYGERADGEVIKPVLTVKMACSDNFASVVNISQATDFVVPDKYHVGLIREKLLGGGELCESEKNMLTIQELREGAQECIKSSRPLVIIADCSAQITLRALGYLRTCDLLTETLVLVSSDRLDKEISEALEFDKISLGVLMDKWDESIAFSMQSLAQTFPVGNLVWTMKKECAADFDAEQEWLLKKWQAENTAPQNCALKIEEICKFY